MQLQFLDVLSPKDIETAFRAASKAHADAVLVLNSPVSSSRRKEIAKLAVKNQLPAFYDRSDYIEDGGLMSYGVSFIDLAHRAATDVDKILKGADPGDLPVEQPKKFEFIINLKAAKQMGLTIPPSVLAGGSGDRMKVITRQFLVIVLAGGNFAGNGIHRHED